MEKVQTIITVLEEIVAILEQYGPLALQIEQLIAAGNWAGVIALIEQILNPRTPMPPNLDKVQLDASAKTRL